jgi:hypothetical protein
MGGFMAIVGVLGFIAALVMIVVKLIAKKGLGYKQLGILAVVSVLLFFVGAVMDGPSPEYKNDREISKADSSAITEPNITGTKDANKIEEEEDRSLEAEGNNNTIYVHKETGVNFVYPKTWIIPKQAPPGFEDVLSETEVLIIANVDEGETFTPNINLVIEKSHILAAGAMEQVETIEATFELFGTQMGLSEYKRLDLEETKTGHFIAAILSYEMVLDQTNQTVIGKQLIAPIGQNTYTLTCTSLASQWQEYEPIFNEVVQSFALK